MTDGAAPPLRSASVPAPIRYAVALVVATAIGLLFASPQWGVGPDWHDALTSSLIDWWAWGLLAVPVMAADRRLRGIGTWFGRGVAHFFVGSLFSIGHVVLRTAMGALVGSTSWASLRPAVFVPAVFQGPYFWGLLVYGLVVGFTQSLHYQRATRHALLDVERMERRYSEARLVALRMQLDPHFLFNALNTISAQIGPAPRVARAMIGHLGDLLRASLDSGSRAEVTLGEELAILDHYLAIQAIRFGDGLRIERHVESDVLRALVPNLLLQPLVENAIRHGIAPRVTGGTLTIEACRRSDRLEIRVTDDGVGMPEPASAPSSTGLGLSITRERLVGRYAEAGRFDIDARPGGGTVVVLGLPYRTAAMSE